jgi:hypothetical protein
MASLMAKKTEIASIKGGSPTAFERCTVASLLRPDSSRRTRNRRGRSLVTGIL